jgi:hypothetical protein
MQQDERCARRNRLREAYGAQGCRRKIHRHQHRLVGLVRRLFDHQHGARGPAHHAVGRGAQQHVPHETGAPRAQHHQVGVDRFGVLAQLSKQRATGHMHLRRDAMAPRHCLGQLLHGVVRGIQHAFFQIRRNLPGQAPQPFYGRGRGNVHQIELRPGCL